MDLDVARIRKSFPALDGGVAYFDGPGGTQVPREVAQAIARHDHLRDLQPWHGHLR